MYNGLYFLWQWQSLFSWVSKSLLMVTTAMKLKDASPWKKSYDKPRQRNEKKRCYFAGKGLYSQSDGFSNSHVQMWELDHKEGWALKNWCFRTVVLGFPCGSVWSVGWEDPLEKGRLPTPVFWPGEFQDCIVHGVAKSRTRLSNFHFHMQVPWTVGSMNESILKEINLKYSLEGLMMKLKLQHFGHLMRRTDPLENTLMLG